MQLLFEGGDHGRHEGLASVVAVEHLADWLRTGDGPAGKPSPVMQPQALQQATTPAERADLVSNWLDAVIKHYSDLYLEEMPGPGRIANARPKVDSLRGLTTAPMFVEVAPLAVEMLSVLRNLVPAALDAARAMDGDSTPSWEVASGDDAPLI